MFSKFWNNLALNMEPIPEVPQQFIEKCHTHDKLIEFFCKTHDKDICANCAVFNHRTCDVIAHDQKEDAVDEILDVLTNKLSLALEIDQKIDKDISSLQKDKPIVQENILFESKSMKEKLDKLEQELLAILDTTYEAQMNAVSVKQNKCKDLIIRTEAALKKAKTSGSEDSVDIEYIKRIATDLEKELPDLSNDTYGVTLRLKINENLKRHIEESTKMGKVLIDDYGNQQQKDGSRQHLLHPRNSPHNKHEKPSGKVSPSSVQFQAPEDPPPYRDVVNAASSFVPTPIPMPLAALPAQELGHRVSAAYLISFKAKSSDDKSHCWISGAGFLDSGNIILADRNNKKLKLFSVSLQLVSEAKLEAYPFDVTQTCDGKIATTIPKKCKIQFFDNALVPIANIDTEQPCLGISAASDKLFVCCESTWSDEGCIKVYDLDNKLLWKLSKDEKGKELFSVTDYIEVCPSSSRIYFKKGGFGKESMYCIDVTGSVKWKSKVPSWLDVPLGIAAVEEGVLIAIGSVKSIMGNGTRWEKLVGPEDSENPCALCVNKDKTVLLVSHSDPITNCSSNDEIKLYQLEYHPY